MGNVEQLPMFHTVKMTKKNENIILLNNGMYEYITPPMPSDEKDILYFDQSKSDQFWKTPVIKNLKHISEKDKIEYINKERQRWEEGVWFFNNGIPTYITGMHYDHLTYMTFKGAKAEYFDHQRFDFYFRDLTWKDPKCRGRVWMKPRRYGMTMEEITESTYRLLEDFSNNVSLQSDTKEKVKTTLLTPIIESYVRRPKFMRSDYYKPNGKLLVSGISLSTDKAPIEGEEEKGDYLLGWLKGFPSLPRSLDGNEVCYSVMDEAFKWTESSVKETLESNIKVLMGRGRAGIVSMLSTMGDSDDYLRAVMDGCDIIARSNPGIRNDNGNTLSGLYEFFVSAIYSLDIPPEVFEVDKFGMVNKDKHLNYIHNKINALDKNSKGYVFEKRRLPLEKADALLSAQLVTYFRRFTINETLNKLRALKPDQKPYVRGNLVDTSSGGVAFEADEENGIWLVSIQPYFSMEKGINTQNRFRKIGNNFCPPINPEYCIGYDPVRYKKGDTKSSNLSRSSTIVHKKFDYFESGIIDVKCGLLIYRPDDPEDAHREVIKACKYWGAPCMHERQVESVKRVFEEMNMMPFLMKNEKDGIHGIWTDSLGKTTKNGVGMLQTRYSAPKIEGDIDQLEIVPFEDQLIDLDNFDVADTTKFDVTMSEIMLEYGLQQLRFTNSTDQSVNERVKMMERIVPARR